MERTVSVFQRVQGLRGLGLFLRDCITGKKSIYTVLLPRGKLYLYSRAE